MHICICEEKVVSDLTWPDAYLGLFLLLELY